MKVLPEWKLPSELRIRGAFSTSVCAKEELTNTKAFLYSGPVTPKMLTSTGFEIKSSVLIEL